MPKPKLLTNTQSNAVLVHATNPCGHTGHYNTEYRLDGTTVTVCANCNAKLLKGRWSA